MTQPKDPQEQLRKVLDEGVLAFAAKQDREIFDQIISLFNDGTLELYVLRPSSTVQDGVLDIKGGVAVTLGPKIKALQSKLEKAEAEAASQLEINKALLRRIDLLEIQALKGEEK